MCVPDRMLGGMRTDMRAGARGDMCMSARADVSAKSGSEAVASGRWEGLNTHSPKWVRPVLGTV